jgi:hypothetical protein
VVGGVMGVVCKGAEKKNHLHCPTHHLKMGARV